MFYTGPILYAPIALLHCITGPPSMAVNFMAYWVNEIMAKTHEEFDAEDYVAVFLKSSWTQLAALKRREKEELNTEKNTVKQQK